MSVFSYTSPYLIVFYDSISLWHFFFCRTLPLLESLFSESSGSSLPCARPNNWLCGSTWVLKARIHARSSRRFRDIFHCLQVFSIRVGVCRFLHWPTHRLRQGKRCHFFNDIFSFHAVVKFPITFLTHYVFIWDLQMFLFNACVFLISWRGIRIPISVRSFSTAPQAQAGRQDLSNHFSALCMLRSCFLWRWRQKFETKSGRIRVQENIPLKEKRTKVRRKSFPGSIWIQFGMQNESGNGSQKGGRKTTSFLEPFS